MNVPGRHSGDPPFEPSLIAGTVISHYTIISPLGCGGMSEVYLAEDKALKRKVALKFLLPSLAAFGEYRALFEREAAGMASISHPHVAVIHDIGAYSDRPFFAMEYIDGRTLQDLIAEGPVTPEKGIDIAVQICEGLAAIHERGLVHRDIKPSNIMIDDSGRVRILDFGISLSSGAEKSPADEITAGTLAYMSPEQITGDTITPSSDLFSFGIVLFQLLAGFRPFEEAYEAALKYAIVNDDPPPLQAQNTDIPQPLAEIVSKLLMKNPADRFRDAAEVADRLRSVNAPPIPDVAPTLRNRRRSNLLLLIILMAVLAATIVSIVIKSSHQRQAARETTVAVLPFRNLGSPDDEYFAEGLTDAVNTRLANIKGLRVISRSSSMTYRQSELSWKEIGAELGADYILTGTIFWDRRGAPDQVRTNTQLIRVDDESYLWGNSYDEKLDRIFSLQSDIAEKVTEVLRIAAGEVVRQSIAAVPTTNLTAYDFFLRGNYYFYRSWDQADITNATDLYQRAVEIDTAFALAYAMLSRGHESMYWEYFDRSDNRCRLAREAAQKALKLDPDLMEARLAQGYIYYHCDQDYERALNEFQSIVEDHPNCSDLYSALGAVQRRFGQLPEAAASFTRASELDPRSGLKVFDIALTYGLMRRFDETDKYVDKTLTLAPDLALPYVYKAWCQIFCSGNIEAARSIIARATGRADLASSRYYWWLSRIIEPDYNKILDVSRPGPDTAEFFLHKARLYRLMDDYNAERRYSDSSMIYLERDTLARPDDPRFISHLGLAYAGLRERENALAFGKKAMELLPASRDAFDAFFLVVNYAEILVIFGEYDAAVDQLEFLMSIPGFVSPPYLRLDPIWKPLQNNPRFQRLLERST